MTERFLAEEACQGSWWVLRSRCCSPYSSMWRLAHIEQTCHIRVIILARIRPQESNKLCEPGRGKIIASDSTLEGQGVGGEASAYLLPQLFLWRGPRVFAYVLLQIQ